MSFESVTPKSETGASPSAKIPSLQSVTSMAAWMRLPYSRRRCRTGKSQGSMSAVAPCDKQGNKTCARVRFSCFRETNQRGQRSGLDPLSLAPHPVSPRQEGSYCVRNEIGISFSPRFTTTSIESPFSVVSRMCAITSASVAGFPDKPAMETIRSPSLTPAFLATA